MSKVTYSGHTFDITPNGMMPSFSGEKYYDIYDDEGYRLVCNFNKSKLKQYRQAVDLIGNSDRTFKIVLDFAPYAVDNHTLRNNDDDHSFWAKPGYGYKMTGFWAYVR